MYDKVQEIISLTQNDGLEKHKSFNTQKQNEAINELKNDFYEIMKNAF